MPVVSGDEIVKKRVEQALMDTAPGFVRAVEKARKEHIDYVLLAFSAFRNEQTLFIRAVQYASMSGVALMIIPEKDSR